MTSAHRCLLGLFTAAIGGVLGCGDDVGEVTGDSESSAMTTGSGSTSAASATGSGTTEDPTTTTTTTTMATMTGAGTGAETDMTTSAETDAETDSETNGGQLPCNGHAALCDRPLDTVALPSTHNSHSALDEGYSQINANHQSGVAQQLEDGVRGLLLDIYLEDGETTLCHGACFLGSTPHADVLDVLAAFMEANPREVIAIIYQDDVDPALVEADFIDAGLDQLVWTWDGGSMPTLGEMIDANTRLIVTAESKGPPPAWYHHAWDVFWDTSYSFASAEDFSCELNRGGVENPLYLVNHWVNSAIDLPSQDNAEEVNAFDVLYGRIEQCRVESGQMPTMVAVDFYEKGDLFAAVEALNGL